MICGAYKWAVRKLSAQTIPVVLTSRVLGVRVLGVYASPGSGAVLQINSAFFASELSSHKARLKLILALGAALRLRTNLLSFFFRSGSGPGRMKQRFAPGDTPPSAQRANSPRSVARAS